ncbi:serine/threonine-protein phosphatase 2A regulatory subunit B'' subunit beta [Panthera pardus]|uniref:Serine/threonine-protein phosphatase 2A regulatory subunit B'' subunit beta n=1 Tax=Panthera pardus TaxID=9691 RepID=A0A9W2ULZ4_PANPR|nr:serine/threonine-protein phosphatase 2A regulatory subunit B'' subunit beta [Panthera pardus]
MWRKILQNCHDDAAKFVHLLMNPGCHYLVQEDFVPFLQDVVNTHPGLAFLKEASEFHSRYITTVIQRIFYTVNRSWSGRITCAELRRSTFLQNVALLEEEADINQLTEYFSYEHFYVIYCKFWELDTDHDLLIDSQDLARHNDHALSTKMIERIFSGAVTRYVSQPPLLGFSGDCGPCSEPCVPLSRSLPHVILSCVEPECSCHVRS